MTSPQTPGAGSPVPSGLAAAEIPDVAHCDWCGEVGVDTIPFYKTRACEDCAFANMPPVAITVTPRENGPFYVIWSDEHPRRWHWA